MAAAQRILAVDLGSSNLKIAQFQVDPVNGLSLLSYHIKDMGLDPNKDQDRFPFIVDTLNTVMAERGLAPAPALAAISGQFVFARFVKLPPVSAGEIEKMIGFEAQQNVPFPIEEVVWDYQLLEVAGSQEVEAVIVAIKKEIVEQAAGAFRASKVPLEKVDVAPLALVNAYYYNYGFDAEPTLLINIGARCTSLVFIEGKKIFVRVIPLGGHLISQNISNEFQEPYIGAELLKKGKGFVGLGGAYQDPDDPAAARISKIARSVFSRLHAEVSRSISFYRNQQAGSAPKRILLAGGGSAMPFADRFFNEKLNIPVEYFNPLRNVAIGPGVDRAQLEAEAFHLGEVVGLGLRRIGECPVEVSLVPDSLREQRQNRGKVPYLVMAAVLWAGMFLILAVLNFMRASEASAETAMLQREFEEKTRLSREIEVVNTSYTAQRLLAQTYLRLVRQRDFWPNLIGVVSRAVSAHPDIWITQMELLNEGAPVDVAPRVEVAPARPARGAAAQQQTPQIRLNTAPTATEVNFRGMVEANSPPDVLNRFVARLSESELFEKVDIVNREPADGDQVALQFLVRATFKENARPSFLP